MFTRAAYATPDMQRQHAIQAEAARLVDAGAEDVSSDDEGGIEVLCAPNDYSQVKAALEGAGLKAEVAEITMKPMTESELEGEDAARMQKLLDVIEDLDDVHPGDLQTMRAVQWAQATLSVAEANRLARAVQGHHAARLPLPVYGPQWFPAHGGLPGYLPGGVALMCENHV